MKSSGKKIRTAIKNSGTHIFFAARKGFSSSLGKVYPFLDCKKQYFLDAAGLILIGAVSLGYVLLSNRFAERHIQFSFLDFPIFVGEILLFACLLLFFSKYWKNLPKFTKWHYVIIGYFVFVIVKALYGYMKWGPLAFRHAALFYYPAFAVFSYAFYRRKLLNSKITLFLALLIISIFAYGKYYDYYLLTLAFLGFVLMKSHPYKGVRIFMLLVLFTFLPYREFFQASRMMVVSNFVSGVYLASMLPFVLKGKRRIKIMVAAVVIGMTLLGLFKFSDHNAVKSIFNFEQMVKILNSSEKDLPNNSNVYGDLKMEQREVKLYNPEVKVEDEPAVTNEQVYEEVWGIVTEQIRKEAEQSSANGQMNGEAQVITSESARKEIEKYFANRRMNGKSQAITVDKVIKEMNEIYSERLEKGEGKSFLEQIEEGGVEEAVIKEKILENIAEKLSKQRRGYNGNIAFRLYIWRDMIAEFVKEKSVIGFDFGKPLRSRVLERTLMGYGDWSRDGWIGAHNSHLHIIYRSGIVGLLWILAYLSILFKMIRQFIRQKSLTGIFLCGIIINGFVAANFLLILELPYTAIPIWTLFGLTYAHCYKNERDKI